MTAVDLTALRTALEAMADPERAPLMRAYMKDVADFLGVAAPDRRVAQREFVAGLRTRPIDEVVDTALVCWEESEREFQYVAADLLRRHAERLEPRHLRSVERLITTRSWWDTVDVLAARVVGPMVAQYPELTSEMDRWVESDDLWLARAAVLHQLGYREATDPDRLFRYCEHQAGHPDFFMRKAIGWSLREYAKIEPDRVRRWVDEHESELAPLSVREARKHPGR